MKKYTEKDYKGLFNIKAMEKVYIKKAMRESEGVRHKAANLLHITERTLYNKLYRHNL